MHRKHFLHKMPPAIVAVAVLFTTAAASGEDAAAINKAVVVAQAGSTGGTIGKQDKSASGGEVRVPTRERRAHVARKHHVAARELREPPVRKEPHRPHYRAASSCGKIPGVWSWSTGVEVIFKPGGTAVYSNSITGTWTCKSNRVVVFWNNGFTDRSSLSRDGTRLDGTNGLGAFLGTHM